MEWWAILGIFFGVLIVLFALGVPVAFAFGVANVIMIFLFVAEGWELDPFFAIARSAFYSLSSFTLIAVPLFIFIGEVLYDTGVANVALDSITKIMGSSIRGVLYYVVIISATMFAAITGSSMASTATLGSAIVPEGLKRGYNKTLLTGTVCGGGALAILIPPSALMVVYAGLTNQSVGKLLISGIVPGLLIGSLLAVFVTVAIRLRPGVAPAREEIEYIPIKRRVVLFVSNVLPLGSIFLAIAGIMYLGVGTPTEAAAGGSVAAIVLALAYRKLSWSNLKITLISTVRTTGMIFLIIAGSKAFSEILAYTGAARGATQFIIGLPLPPQAIMVVMIMGLVILGCFMESISIMFISVPLYMPVGAALGWDPIWFSILMVMSIELGVLTPPFGMNLFVIKSVVPAEVTLSDIYVGGTCFAALHLTGVFLVMLFPQLVLFLPSTM